MAVERGVSCGFVEASPSDDPGGGFALCDNIMKGFKDTSPATATKVTEIGWHCQNSTQAANYEVAIYSHDSGNDRPDSIVGTKDDTNAKGTGTGWKKVVGLNIPISSSTIYWMAMQLDNTASSTYIDNKTSATGRVADKSNASTLPDPWDGTSESDNYLYAIYAVWEAGEPPPPPPPDRTTYLKFSGTKLQGVKMCDG